MKQLFNYIRNRTKSFEYAFRGLWFFVSRETPAALHIIVIFVVVGLGIFLGLSPLEWAVLILSVSGLLTAEMLNSALEKLGNAITTQHNDRIGKAKDLAAGAVLCMSVAVLIIAAIIMVPKLEAKFSTQGKITAPALPVD